MTDSTSGSAPPTPKIRRNVEAQERVVSALWTFAAAQQRLDPRRAATGNDGTVVSLEAVGVAMKEILDAFGFTVTRID